MRRRNRFTNSLSNIRRRRAQHARHRALTRAARFNWEAVGGNFRRGRRFDTVWMDDYQQVYSLPEGYDLIDEYNLGNDQRTTTNRQLDDIVFLDAPPVVTSRNNPFERDF